MVSAKTWLFVILIVPVSLTVGCSPRSGGVQELEPIVKHLQSINHAYVKTTQQLGRPPKNAEEIRSALQEVGDPDKLLRSPIDGEEFVIIWGVDPRTEPPKDGKLPVLVYEKKGTGGKRYVWQLPTRIVAMTDDELRTAYFPGNHRFSP